MKNTLDGLQINWNRVFYFSEVASCGSLKEASAKLGLSPSTLSEHIAQLETDLGVQLFHRQHRKLALSTDGNRLFLRAKEMFEAGQRLIDALAPSPLGCYPIRIGLIPSSSIQNAYHLIGDFIEENGPLNVKIVHSKHAELEARLARGEFDFGFSDRVPERRDLSHLLVSNSNIKFFVAPKWGDLSFSELAKRLPLLVCNTEPLTRTFAEQALGDAGYPTPAVVTSDFPSVLIDLCMRGLGIGVFAEEPVRLLYEESLKMFRVPRDAPKLQDNLYLLWAKEGENRQALKKMFKVLGS